MEMQPAAPAADAPAMPPASATSRATKTKGRSNVSSILFLLAAAVLVFGVFQGWFDNAADVFLPDLKWHSITPELVILLFALLAPLISLWDTDRRGMQQFAAIGLGGAFLLVLGS